jgi:hypothetical protein
VLVRRGPSGDVRVRFVGLAAAVPRWWKVSRCLRCLAGDLRRRVGGVGTGFRR